MKKITLLSISAILSVLLFSSMKCEKENQVDRDGLPNASQTGAMVFACRINGENWVSRKSTNSIGGGINNDILAFHGINDSRQPGDFETLDIQIDQVSSAMLYKLDNPNGRFATYTTNRKCFNVVSSTGRVKSAAGELNLTRIDRTNRIISGTFWCDIRTEKCGTIKITDGRFDIRY